MGAAIMTLQNSSEHLHGVYAFPVKTSVFPDEHSPKTGDRMLARGRSEFL
ncbi:hypothetical protein KCP71_03945 [Salmonella enterica subsp. enterica]|nr:hypothetical protein KCP71_03945 [Salmonella enterica subsp. enterica]